MTPGTKTAPEVPEGGTLPRGQVATTVITAGDELLRTTAARRDDLRATVRALPGFLQSLGTAATSTRALTRDLLPAVRDLRPVARDLKPTLDGGAQLGDDLRGVPGTSTPC